MPKGVPFKLKENMHPLHETLKDTATRDLIIADQRCTGRSTVIALDLLSTAMKNPHQWIPIKDHSTSLDADEHLMRMVCDIIRKLELQAFQFRVVGREWSIAFGAPKDV